MLFLSIGTANTPVPRFLSLFHFQTFRQAFIKVLYPCVVCVLCRLHRTYKKARSILKLRQSPIIVHLMLVIYHEWHDVMPQTLAKENQTSHSAVAVLERVYAFKTPMIFGKRPYRYFFLSGIPSGQCLHFLSHIGRTTGLPSSDFICQPLPIADIEVWLLYIGGSGLQYTMEFLDYII